MPFVEYKKGESFPGVIGRTADESSPAWPAPTRAKEGAPNVLFVVLDDTGFGQLGCYGSPIEIPNFDRLAAGGLRYTNMHTTALCSPSRSCIVTGRNHHSNGMACITELASGYPGRLDKRNMLPRYCLDCYVRFACHGGCPKDRFIETPNGEPSLNYLCAGYMDFFNHVDRPMRFMAEQLRNGRAPSEIVAVYAAEDANRGRNDHALAVRDGNGSTATGPHAT